MNLVFHYHITYLLALRAGFSRQEALTIAHSCSRVDHALIPYVLEHGGKEHELTVTHHFGFWSATQSEKSWMPFHFFPGAEADQTDEDTRITDNHFNSAETIELRGKHYPSRLCVVRPKSEGVKELLVSALRSGNLFRTGIALHTFADSWAHQNFVGSHSSINKVPGALPLPPIGHAQLESIPDIFHMEWTDARLAMPLVSNQTRFTEAMKFIYRFLAHSKGRSFADDEVVVAEILARFPGPETAPEKGRAPGALLSSWNSLRANFGSTGTNVLVGPSDKLMARALESPGVKDQEPVPPWDSTWWYKELFPESGRPAILEEEKRNSKSAWLQHQVKKNLKIEAPRLKTRVPFDESRLLQWDIAAREHREVALSIIARSLC